MKEPFRIHAKKIITQTIEHRLFLIRNNISKNFVSADQCNNLRNKMALLASDNQIALFVQANKEMLLHLVPSSNKKNILIMHDLIQQSKQVINKQPIKQSNF